MSGAPKGTVRLTPGLGRVQAHRLSRERDRRRGPDSSGKVVGIVTEADLLLGKEAAAEERFESLAPAFGQRRQRARARAEVAAQAMSSPDFRLR